MTSVMTYDSLSADIPDYLDRDDARLLAQVPNFISLGEIRCAREVKNLGFKVAAVGLFAPGQYDYLKPNRWLQTVSMNFGNAEGYNTVSRARTSNTVTLTLATPHNFEVGDPISVYNVGGTGYNGNWQVTSIALLTVSYTAAGSNEATTADTGGIATPPLENRTTILPRSLEYCNEYWPDRTQTGEPKFYADYDYSNWLVVPTPQIAYPFEIIYFQQPEYLSETNQTNWLTQYAPDLLLYACLLESAPYLKDDARIAMWQERYDRSAASISGQNKARVNDASIMRPDA